MNFLVSILPHLGKDVERSLSTGTLVVTARFSLKNGTVLPEFLYELFSVLYDKSGKLRRNHIYVQRLRQLLLIFYKYEVPFTPAEEQAAYLKFIELDDQVKTDHWPEDIGVVRQHLNTLLPDDPLDIRPHHSSGQTADRVCNSMKRRFRRYIPSLMSIYDLSYFFQSADHARAWFSHNKLYASEPTARVTLVPKDSRGPRIICMEPHERMFVQKGLMQKIYDHIENDSPAKGYINFTNQETNRDLARQGSIDQRFATIDLKDASDMVSWELLKRVLPIKWIAALSATRSSKVDCDGQIVQLNKYAPMGSALCFPLEAMLFWAIARTVTDKVWVYGDDIVVHDAYAHGVMSALESYGLVINRDKSLTEGFFRESCGGDYFHGHNISYVRLKSLNVEPYVAFCNLITKAYGEETSRLLIGYADNEVSGTIIRREPLSQSGSPEPLVYYTSYTSGNVLLKHRYNDALQRTEVRSLTVTTTSKRDNSLNDYDSLFEWMTNSLKSSSPDEDRITLDLEREYGNSLWDKPPHRVIPSTLGDINSWALNSRIKFNWGTTMVHVT